MGRALRTLAILGTIAACAIVPRVAAAPPETEPVAQEAAPRAEREVQPEGVQPPTPSTRARADASRTRHVRIGAPAQEAYPKQLMAPSPGVPLAVGFARSVTELQGADATARHLDWQPLDEGAQVASLAIGSSGAAALRVGLVASSLPAEAVLRFRGAGGADRFAVTGLDVRNAVERNVAAGGEGAASRMYWSPVVEGDTLTLEIELPPGADPGAVRIALPMVSHLVASPRDAFAKAAASSCELDAMCYQGAWGSESSAIARMLYTSGGTTYVCTGTLLADKDSATFIPYFLTANHCISTQAAASSLQTYWFYRSSACDSAGRGPYQALAGGATLLYASTATDTALLRLDGAPPAGATYAGWNAGAVFPGASVTGIHHPGGDLQKIAFGALQGYWMCSPVSSGQFTCNGAGAAGSGFYGVDWSRGLTEAGSSGSALFTDDGHYLVGQLYGGGSTCTGGGPDFYGRFDVAYNTALSQWLGAAPGASAPTTPAAPATFPAANFTGMWWNPAQSGWGLAVTEHANGTMFAAWYVYDADGRALWIVMPGGSWTTSSTFAGDLYTATGSDPTGAFDPASVTRTRVGSGRIEFSATDRATFSYTVSGVSESRALELAPFGVPDSSPAVSYADMWWNSSESGWGLSISQQYRTLFAVWYKYRPDGSPEWLVMPGGAWTAADTYVGTLYRTSAPPRPFFGAAFDPSSIARTVVGTLTLRFTSAGTATMSYSVDGVAGAKAISRQPF